MIGSSSLVQMSAFHETLHKYSQWPCISLGTIMLSLSECYQWVHELKACFRSGNQSTHSAQAEKQNLWWQERRIEVKLMLCISELLELLYVTTRALVKKYINKRKPKSCQKRSEGFGIPGGKIWWWLLLHSTLFVLRHLFWNWHEGDGENCWDPRWSRKSQEWAETWEMLQRSLGVECWSSVWSAAQESFCK